jgi:diaminohydroxyphosphoribosylaminopyrimidine deaminase/5-amino-6-(5-phosphoribosylamino)uracil reductase
MNHQKFMQRCLDLAQKAKGHTYPNPMVGSVVVYNDKIIGEGYHQQAGHPHAEVNAINNVTETHLLKKATLYVNLEPCCHTGKTPPCSQLIISKEIPNVVIGTQDPHSKVAGKGIEQLQSAGINVTLGVLKKEAQELNRRFFNFHQKKRPYIVLKWAETTDGFIAPQKRSQQAPVWITGKKSRNKVHQWRTEEQSILVGTQTVIDDNPQLTARGLDGNQPLRIVIDRALKIDRKANVFDSKAETLLISQKSGKGYPNNVRFATVDFSKPLAQQICNHLHQQNIQSIIVEGGSKTLQTFINENLWDEARVFRGNESFTKGVKAPKLQEILVDKSLIGEDELFIYRNQTLF